MPDFPLSPRLFNQATIGTFSPESLGSLATSLSVSVSNSIVWPVANLAIYVPVEIYNPITIVKMAVNNGTVVSGNIDVGIYRADGTKVVTIGTTAQAGTSAIQIFDITDTLLMPGLYYMAVAMDNTTGTLMVFTGGVAPDMAACGLFQQASAFVLPSPAVFATFAQTTAPVVMMTSKTTI